MMDGRIVRCSIIISCQSAATSEMLKCFWSQEQCCIKHWTFTWGLCVASWGQAHREGGRESNE